jgi:RimJ/RimL family protein N-acetyltransferase
MTATVPEHRGRGLARLAKITALRRAGARFAYTGNDESNLPMLAVNTRLGYRPVATQWSCVATL